MKIVIHALKGCHLCANCKKLFKHWDIPYKIVYDNPEQDRDYPYIEVEYEFKEIVDHIAKGKFP